MAITNVSAPNPLDQLAKALVTRFDANQDGQLTTDEFTSFLTSFLGSSVNGLTNGTKTGVTDGTATANGLKNGTVPPRLRGFNAEKLADKNHTTVKYQIGRVMQQYSLEGVKNKSDAEALLTSMKADFEAAGVTVLAIERDKMKIKDDAGQDVWLDVVNGADSGNPSWQWLDLRHSLTSASHVPVRV